MGGDSPKDVQGKNKIADPATETGSKPGKTEQPDPFGAADLLTQRIEKLQHKSYDDSWLKEFTVQGLPSKSDSAPSVAVPLKVSDKAVSEAVPPSSEPKIVKTERVSPQSENTTQSTLPTGKNDATNAAGTEVAASKPPETPEQRQQREYDQIHGKYMKELDTYWKGVSAAKNANPPKIVMEFEPIYKGPDKPKTSTPPSPSTLPTLNDMISNSKDLMRAANQDSKQPSFNLGLVSEPTFKQRYAHEAEAVGAKHGLDQKGVKEIVQSIYAFEDGGWGTHDTLSNMSESMVKADQPGSTAVQDKRRDFHPGSTAVGYNQLLMLNTLKTAHQDAGPVAARLKELAAEDPSRSKILLDKATMLQTLSAGLDKELKAMAKTDPKKYLDNGEPNETLYADFVRSKDPSLYGKSLSAGDPDKANATRRNLAIGVHGLNLDGDIGPIIQAKELENLLTYADNKGFKTLLSDKIKADKQLADVYDKLPPDQKLKGAKELLSFAKPPAVSDPVAQKEFSDTKHSLEQKLAGLKPGADPAISKTHLNDKEQEMLNSVVLTRRRLGEPSGALSSSARTVLDKAWYSHYGGYNEAKIMAAALELANLGGTGKALSMIKQENADYPTVNWFNRAGYEANPVTNRRTADELLMSIYRVMSGSSRDPAVKVGQADFDKAFANVPTKVPSKPVSRHP